MLDQKLDEFAAATTHEVEFDWQGNFRDWNGGKYSGSQFFNSQRVTCGWVVVIADSDPVPEEIVQKAWEFDDYLQQSIHREIAVISGEDE